MVNPQKPVKEDVVKELASLGKYKVRVLEDTKTGEKVLDIREHVIAPQFSGYTRRGVRLTPTQVALLGDILSQARESLGY